MVFVVKKSKASLRNEKERKEANMVRTFAAAFNSIYKDHFGIYNRVLFAVFDKLKEREKYIDISLSPTENCFQIDINPILVDEDKITIQQNGKRAAVKLYLLQHKQPTSDSSLAYQRYAKMFHLWLYSRTFKTPDGKTMAFNYPETPHKWHVYSCSVCGRPMLVYAQKQKSNYGVLHYDTVWHKKNSNSDTEKPHQGKYAYSGVQLLKNWEMQSIKFTMQQIINEHDGGRDTAPKYYYNYDDDFGF